MRRPFIPCLLAALVVLGACVPTASASVRRFTPITANGVDQPGAPAWGADQYDTVQPTTDRPDLTSLPTVHAVYLYASDRPNRFARYAAMFQRDARGGSGSLTQAIGMAFRWDERPDARGGDRPPLLDITVVKSRSTFAKLSSSRAFSIIQDDVRRVGLTNPNK